SLNSDSGSPTPTTGSWAHAAELRAIAKSASRIVRVFTEASRGILLRPSGSAVAPPGRMWAAFDVPLSWGALLKRTGKDSLEDDCLGLAAQLAYYFFLALFPSILFIFA